MMKDLYMKKSKDKVVLQSDDLIYDGKNFIIPSYYCGVITDYLATVDTQNMNDADKQDFMAFCSFFEAVLDLKDNKIK
jgi:hypothetical protein